jgi:hypothetical protein
MFGRLFIPLLFIFISSYPLAAQQQVTGRIYAAVTDSVISQVTIYNKTQRVTVSSAKDGRYRISANENDTLLFSASGFLPDSISVRFDMLLTNFDVTLKRKIVTLETVRLISSYRQDSLERRNYYNDIFKKQPGLTGFNSPEKGAGVVLSPFSFFSKAAREKRILKKRLLRQEQEDYIDRSFPAQWVARLTGLQGDSLNLFLYRYRPSYSFCRKTGRDAMLVYINDKFKEFRKAPGNG